MKEKIPGILMVCGAISFLTGELIGAFSKRGGDTFSEWFKGQPKIVQFVIIGCTFGVVSHLAEWKIRDAAESQEK